MLDDVADFLDSAAGFFSLQGVGQAIYWALLVPNGVVLSKDAVEVGALIPAGICAFIAWCARMEALDRENKRTEAEQAKTVEAMQRRDAEKRAQEPEAKRPVRVTADTKPFPALQHSAPVGPKTLDEIESELEKAKRPVRPTADAKPSPALQHSAPVGPKTLDEIESELEKANLPRLSPDLRAALRDHGHR